MQGFLRVVAAPGAEIASALAVRLLAQRVRTGAGPEGDVTPGATLHGTSQSVWPHVEAHGVVHLCGAACKALLLLWT